MEEGRQLRSPIPRRLTTGEKEINWGHQKKSGCSRFHLNWFKQGFVSSLKEKEETIRWWTLENLNMSSKILFEIHKIAISEPSLSLLSMEGTGFECKRRRSVQISMRIGIVEYIKWKYQDLRTSSGLLWISSLMAVDTKSCAISPSDLRRVYMCQLALWVIGISSKRWGMNVFSCSVESQERLHLIATRDQKVCPMDRTRDLRNFNRFEFNEFVIQSCILVIKSSDPGRTSSLGRGSERPSSIQLQCRIHFQADQFVDFVEKAQRIQVPSRSSHWKHKFLFCFSRRRVDFLVSSSESKRFSFLGFRQCEITNISSKQFPNLFHFKSSFSFDHSIGFHLSKKS